jgi:hypothetical protein
MTNVVYNTSASSPFLLSYEAMKKFNKLGFKYPKDIPRHHPLLIHLYEENKEDLQSFGCRLSMKKVNGCVYTIISRYGQEEVKEPNDIKWTIIST